MTELSLPLFAVKNSNGQIDKNAQALFKGDQYALVGIFAFGWYDKYYFLQADIGIMHLVFERIRFSLGLPLSDNESNKECVLKTYLKLFHAILEINLDETNPLYEKAKMFEVFCQKMIYEYVPERLLNEKIPASCINLAIAVLRYEIGIRFYNHKIS